MTATLRDLDATVGSVPPTDEAPETFDRAYYDRYYRDPQTRVTSPEEHRRLVDFVELPTQSVLDLGCGIGMWRDALEDIVPELRYQGVEVSDYLCETYGWKKASAAEYRDRRRYDLVVCQGVLQYLDDDEAERAIANIARLSRSAVYIEALTEEDWRQSCDQTRTDGSVHRRPVAWYRERLDRELIAIGGGVFVRKSARVSLYALERSL